MQKFLHVAGLVGKSTDEFNSVRNGGSVPFVGWVRVGGKSFKNDGIKRIFKQHSHVASFSRPNRTPCRTGSWEIHVRTQECDMRMRHSVPATAVTAAK